MSDTATAPGQVMIMIDSAGNLDAIRSWYEKEKIPAVLAVPGVTGVTQWVVEHRYTAGPGGGQIIIPAPNDYVVMVELADVNVARSDAFLDAVGRDFHQSAEIDGAQVRFNQVMSVTLETIRDTVNPGKEGAKTGAMLVVSLTPEREYVDMFQDWYDKEHVGELMSCPGFLRTRRYEALDGVPNWFANYELDEVDTLQSPEFLYFSGRSRDQLPPIHQEVGPHMEHNMCHVFRRLD